MLTQAFAPPPGANPSGLRVLISNHLAARWQAQCAGAWVVDAPGFGPVGAAFAVVEPEVGWIGGLGVHPAYRGLGVGRALTTAALEFLEDSGGALVGLEASPSDGAVLGAYARRGLRPVDVTLRLRADAAALTASGVAAELQLRPLCGSGGSPTASTFPDEVLRSDSSGAADDRVARQSAAVPLSDAAFMAVGPGACLVCDPEAIPVGDILEVRVGFMGRDGHSAAAACRALGRRGRWPGGCVMSSSTCRWDRARRWPRFPASGSKPWPARFAWRGQWTPTAVRRTTVWCSGAGRSSAARFYGLVATTMRRSPSPS